MLCDDLVQLTVRHHLLQSIVEGLIVRGFFRETNCEAVIGLVQKAHL